MDAVSQPPLHKHVLNMLKHTVRR